MEKARKIMSSKIKSQIKVKRSKSISDSDGESEHELFHYANDRVKLMKQVLRLIKPKQIKAIAPDFMKNSDIEEINSLLLEELLGISNKRLKHILDGVNVDNDSSTDSDVEKEPIDIISLDDISDVEIEDDFESECSEAKKSKGNSKCKNTKTKDNKSKKKRKVVEIKEENTGEKEKLMSVLEILELQARARAIRSQLALEKSSKTSEAKPVTIESDDDPDDVIVEVLKNEEIVISSSDSENGDEEKRKKNVDEIIKDTNQEDSTTKINSTGNKESSNKDLKDEETNSDNTSKEEESHKTFKEKCQQAVLEKENIIEESPSKKEKRQVDKNAMEIIKEVEKPLKIMETEKRCTQNYASSEHDDAVIINLDELEFEEIEK